MARKSFWEMMEREIDFQEEYEKIEDVIIQAEAAKWLSKDELNSVRWLPADLMLIEKIKKYLEVELHE